MARQPSTEKYAYVQPQPSISEEDYMKNRVVYKIIRYTDGSKKQKLWYQLTSVLAIICAASVPVLVNIGVVDDIVPTFLSLLVAILISLEKLFHFREHWRNYDAIAAALRSEQLQFQTLSGVYKEKAAKPKDAFRLFVKRFEEIIQEERDETIEMRTQENG